MRKKGPPLTRQMASYIKHLLETTDLNHAQIAALVGGINQGRVSEIKTGKRFQDVSPTEWAGA